MTAMEGESRHSKEEMRRLGEHSFQARIQPLVDDRDQWDTVSIDVETGDFEVDRNPLAATERLLARRSHAQI